MRRCTWRLQVTQSRLAAKSAANLHRTPASVDQDTVPVMKPASSLHRNAAQGANLFYPAQRPTGIF